MNLENRVRRRPVSPPPPPPPAWQEDKEEEREGEGKRVQCPGVAGTPRDWSVRMWGASVPGTAGVAGAVHVRSMMMRGDVVLESGHGAGPVPGD